MPEIEELVDAKLRILLTDHSELVALIHQFPELVEKEISTLERHFEALRKGLEEVPAEYDISHGRKINQILDVSQEIDKHTVALELLLSREIPRLLERHADAIKENSKPPYFTVYLTGLCGAVIGAVSCLAYITYIL